MVFPDSSWLEKLEKAPLSLLFSIAVAAGAVWWFLDLSKWSLVGAVFCFFTAISLCVLRIVTRAWQRFARWRANRLMRCFDELSEEQKDYLRRVFSTGRREFRESRQTSSLRWFEELINWNYVKRIAVSQGRHPSLFEVTEKGWRELISRTT